jgi:hypothetical protein
MLRILECIGRLKKKNDNTSQRIGHRQKYTKPETKPMLPRGKRQLSVSTNLKKSRNQLKSRPKRNYRCAESKSSMLPAQGRSFTSVTSAFRGGLALSGVLKAYSGLFYRPFFCVRFSSSSFLKNSAQSSECDSGGGLAAAAACSHGIL